MTTLKILCGIIFFLLGLGYLYQPNFILRINVFFRNYLFNDRFLLERRKWGIFFLLLSVIAFYMGITALLRNEKKQFTTLPKIEQRK
jgi:hypothetical protein